MEVSNLPPTDPPPLRAGTAAGSSPGPTTIALTATPTDTESSSAPNVISVADLADIRPLDLVAALQILVAEVRAGLDASLEGSVALSAATQNAGAQYAVSQSAIAQSPLQAAHELVDMFLRALPEDASDAPAWTAALIQVETTVQSSLERAVSVVAAWRDTPPLVVDAAKETRVLFIEALGDEPQNLSWLRPEWMGLGAPFHRFWRRRRNARRRLTDPDCPLVNLDDNEEFRR